MEILLATIIHFEINDLFDCCSRCVIENLKELVFSLIEIIDIRKNQIVNTKQKSYDNIKYKIKFHCINEQITFDV